jgi:hypothetical protein
LVMKPAEAEVEETEPATEQTAPAAEPATAPK